MRVTFSRLFEFKLKASAEFKALYFIAGLCIGGLFYGLIQNIVVSLHFM
jgi:hypothetical protein